MDTLAGQTYVSNEHKVRYFATRLYNHGEAIVSHWPACRKAKFWLPAGHTPKHATQFFPVPQHPDTAYGTCPGCAVDIWVTIVTGKSNPIPASWVPPAAQSETE
jgi:hypothetical protein